MTTIELILQITFTAVVVLLAGLAMICYYALFYMVMIAWDGCEICQKLKQNIRTHFSHGRLLSRPRVISS